MRRRGSTLVESSIVLMLFLVILIGVLDAGQILFFHQFLTARVREGARWASVNTYDSDGIRNVVAYNSTTRAPGATGLFGLNTSMVQVNRYDSGTASDRVEVKISGYQLRFLSPWLAGAFTPGPFRAVMPMESAGAAQ